MQRIDSSHWFCQTSACTFLSAYPQPPFSPVVESQKISSIMEGSPLSLCRTLPNLQLPIYIFIPNMVPVWFGFMVWSMLVAGEEGAMEGVIVGYSAVGLPPASCPFCTLNSNAWPPRTSISSFLALPTQFYPNQWPQYPSVLSSDASLYPSHHSNRKPLLYILRVRDKKSGKASRRKLHMSWDLKDKCDFHREGWQGGKKKRLTCSRSC